MKMNFYWPPVFTVLHRKWGLRTRVSEWNHWVAGWMGDCVDEWVIGWMVLVGRWVGRRVGG